MLLVYSFETVHVLGERTFTIEFRLKINFLFLTEFTFNLKVIEILQLLESKANETV